MPALLLFLFSLLAAAGEASAHASLRGATPPDGAMLETAPATIELVFSEPVALLAYSLATAEGGTVAARAEATGDGSRLLFFPAEALARGSYLLRWRVASLDGHPVAGRIAFSIGAIPALAPAESEAVPVPLLAARALHLATTVLGGGAGIALLLLPLGSASRTRTVRLARILLLAALPAALFRFAATGLEATGLPALALAGPEPWSAALATGVHAALATTTAGCLLLAISIGGGAPPTLPALFGLLLAAGGFGLTGHTATAAPVVVFAPALVLHLLGAMFWLGALVPLALALRHDPPATARAVFEQFSERALLVVPTLLALGLLLAMRQLPDGGALLASPWGRLLLFKLALLAGLLAVAAINRLRLVPALSAGDPGARPALSRLLALDLALAIGLLAVTAALGAAPPPRLPHPGAGQELRLAGAGLAARVEIAPARPGWNRLAIALDPARPPPLEVRLRLVPENGAGEPLEATATAADDGTYRTDPLLLVPAGTWQLAVGVLLDPFTRVELSGRLSLP